MLHTATFCNLPDDRSGTGSCTTRVASTRAELQHKARAASNAARVVALGLKKNHAKRLRWWRTATLY